MICIKCGDVLNDDNWYPSNKTNRMYICKSCTNTQTSEWRMANPEKYLAVRLRSSKKQGNVPMGERRDCPAFLGIHVAERVLSHVFKNVKRTPYNNKGFDFICNRGMKIDVKSSCTRMLHNRSNLWQFCIANNEIADYFILIAFDNREDITPLHIWMMPGNGVNHLSTLSISESTIHKWDEYRLDINKVVACCDAMKIGRV